MKPNEFIQKHKAKLIIAGIILVIAIIFILSYLNQTVVDEKYCDGITIGCQFDETRGCINELQIGFQQVYNGINYCYCNTTDSVCEGEYISVVADMGDEVEGKTCFDEKECVIDSPRKAFTKCVAENADSTQGKCTKWDRPLEGCNYYMIDGKAKEICYKK